MPYSDNSNHEQDPRIRQFPGEFIERVSRLSNAWHRSHYSVGMAVANAEVDISAQQLETTPPIHAEQSVANEAVSQANEAPAGVTPIDSRIREKEIRAKVEDAFEEAA